MPNRENSVELPLELHDSLVTTIALALQLRGIEPKPSVMLITIAATAGFFLGDNAEDGAQVDLPQIWRSMEKTFLEGYELAQRERETKH